MAKCQRNAHISASQLEEEDDYTEMEDFDSDDSEDDPSYIDNLNKTHFNLANLSLKSSVRYHEPIELDDDDDDDDDDDEVEELSAPKLGIKDMKDFEDIQRIIDCGQVEKLKVDQCKVYLRKHGLRLAGKKDILIQRIKEHLEIVNGGGEKKFPPSSFVLNCKGDACMGDVVMFEQTVYEGYNIASRSAIGPPCGKRTVVGRVVKESYGAAKQQHTFTVEVLWSKGDKPLPPLHPLLIKGRNLYKLNTLRQRWEDEAERHRVLSEKHSRGSVARSNREARIQEKTLRKTLKNTRAIPNGQHSRQEKNHKLANDHISFNSKNQGSKAQKQHTVAKNYQQQQTNQDQNLRAAVEFKENSCGGIPIPQPSQQDKTSVPASRVCLAKKDHNSSISHIDPSTHLHRKLVESRVGSHCRLPINPHLFQVPTTSAHHFQNQKPPLYLPEHGNLISSAPWVSAFSDTSHFRTINRQHNSYGRNNQKEAQQLCRYYPRGKCHYGMHCKFLHVPNRNQC